MFYWQALPCQVSPVSSVFPDQIKDMIRLKKYEPIRKIAKISGEAKSEMWKTLVKLKNRKVWCTSATSLMVTWLLIEVAGWIVILWRGHTFCSDSDKSCKTDHTDITVQMNNDPKHISKTAQEFLKGKKWNIHKCHVISNQYMDLTVNNTSIFYNHIIVHISYI